MSTPDDLGIILPAYPDIADKKVSVEENERTYSIIGAAMEVHRALGPGFLEAVYGEALGIEFFRSEIPFIQEPLLEIHYKSIPLHHHYRPDFLCFGSIILELKAQSRMSGTEEAQIINYLKASGQNLGLLINFGVASLAYRRFILTHRTSDQESPELRSELSRYR
jgi:GxxExxY protein